MDEGEINDNDLLSKMPEHIIHHILSFLSPRLIAQFSILSKTLRRSWASLPIFNFNEYSFKKGLGSVLLTVEEEEKYVLQSANKIFDTEEEKIEYIKKLRFFEHLDKSLRRVHELHLRIKNLRLCTSMLEIELRPNIDRWIGLAAERYVEKLDLELPTEGGYSLPETILVAKSLTVLKLMWCRLDQPFLRETSLMFSSLRKLVLDSVQVDDQIVENFIRGCPLIETLSLQNCLGLKCIRVYGLDKLMKIVVYPKLDEVESVDIVAPSLQTLSYGCFGLSGKLPKFHVDGCGQSLIKLCLTGTLVTEQLFNDLLSRLPLLEILHLDHCKMLERINISGRRLKVLELENRGNLVAIEIDTPNLHLLKYRTVGLPYLLFGNISDHIEIEIRIIDYQDMLDTHWFFRLKEFLTTFKEIKSLEISLHLGAVEILLISKEVSESLMARDVEHLELIPSIHEDSTDDEYSCLLDGLLWSFHPKTICLKASLEEDYSTVMLLYDKIMNYREGADSSNSGAPHDIKCWWHCLKDIKVTQELTMPLDWDTDDALGSFELKW